MRKTNVFDNNSSKAATVVPGQRKIGFYSVVIAVLIGFGIASRFLLVDYPNFKPIAAIAIFCGFYFARSRGGLLVSICTAFGIMLISDATLGFYELPVMIAVYGSILVACVLGNKAGRWFADSSNFVQLGSLTASALIASCIFFLLTNAAVVFAGWYPFSIEGFLASYVAGIPFFKFTILGDLLFTAGIFGVYGFLKTAWGSRSTVGRLQNSSIGS